MIKKISAILLTTILTSCAAGPVYAQRFLQRFPYIAMESCDEVSSVAEVIMKARQEGVPMKTQYSRAAKVDDDVFAAWAKEMIAIAYDSPKYTSRRYQDQAVSEFGSRVFVQCLKDEKILRK